MGLSEKYRKSLEMNWALQLKTAIPEGGAFHGVVTHNRRSMVFLREFSDFAADGVLVLPKKQIRGYRDGGFERCENAILRDAEALDNLRPLPWLDQVETLFQLFEEMKARDFWPGVEMLIAEGRGSALYIGPILAVDHRGFTQYAYDANGKWEKAYRLTYERIGRILLGDNYTTRFNRYMRKHGSKKLEKIRKEYQP